MIKRFLPPGDLAARSRAELDYDKARAAFNGVIGELQTALADKTEAAALGDFETRVAAGSAAREALCRQAEALAPAAEPGTKGSPRRWRSRSASWRKGRSASGNGSATTTRRGGRRSAPSSATPRWPAFAEIDAAS